MPGRTARVVVSLAWAVASVDAWKKKQAVEEPPSTFDPMQAVEEAGSLFTHFSSALAGGSLGGEDRLPKIECGTDALIFAVYALVLFGMTWGVRVLAVHPIARAIGFVKQSKIEKFAQATMELITYFTFAVVGCIIVPRQPWAWPSSQWWDGLTTVGSEGYPGPHSRMTKALCCFYILYASRYFANIVSVMIEHRRKDFLEMQIHHVVTVFLVAISYVYGFNRIGVVIMVLLDPADVPLQAAKMMKYMGELRSPDNTDNIWQFMADRFFELFAVVFFLTRLVAYPYVVWSAQVESARYFTWDTSAYLCVILLYILLALQVYWFKLLADAAYRIIVLGKPVEDIRSDDEEEDADKASVQKSMTRKKKAA